MVTRERLIESMQQLLWDRGYVGTSPKAVQQMAGAGQGSMYHHFSGKPDLALAAIRRSVEQSLVQNLAQLSGEGSAFQRLEGFLLRERNVMRGCPIGRLTQDPDILANQELRKPLDEAFGRLRNRMVEVFAEGQASGEFIDGINGADVVTALIGIVQGGHILSRAAGTEEPFQSAIRGALGMLAGLRVTRILNF